MTSHHTEQMEWGFHDGNPPLGFCISSKSVHSPRKLLQQSPQALRTTVFFFFFLHVICVSVYSTLPSINFESRWMIQYFGHLMWKTDSVEKTLMLRNTERSRRGDDRGWDGCKASPLNGHEFEQAPGDGDGQGSLECCSPWGHKQLDMTEQLNWIIQAD